MLRLRRRRTSVAPRIAIVLAALGLVAVACGGRTALDATPTLECRGPHVPALDAAQYDAQQPITACLATVPLSVARAGVPSKVFQLLDDVDRQTPAAPTRNRTLTRFGLLGADEGAPVVHKGRLYLLMEDAVAPNPDDPLRPRDADVILWTDAPGAGDAGAGGIAAGFDLDAYRDVDGQYLGLRVDGHFLCQNDGPSAGFSDGESFYALFHEGAYTGEIDPLTGQRVAFGFLGVSSDDAQTFHRLYELPSAEMVYTQALVVPTGTLGGLPWTDDVTVLVFGRRSNEAPVVAAVPLDAIKDANRWVWWAGTDATGSSRWSSADTDAVRSYCQLPDELECLGNFSVSFVPGLGKWLMTGRCRPPKAPDDDPKAAIGYRVADTPLGPWSALGTYFSATHDGGYCAFVHRCCGQDAGACARACCDTDYTPYYDGAVPAAVGEGPAFGEGDDGFTYGPFVLPQWDRWDPRTRTATIYTLVSTGNPYTPQLLRVDLTAQ